MYEVTYSKEAIGVVSKDSSSRHASADVRACGGMDVPNRELPAVGRSNVTCGHVDRIGVMASRMGRNTRGLPETMPRVRQGPALVKYTWNWAQMIQEKSKAKSLPYISHSFPPIPHSNILFWPEKGTDIRSSVQSRGGLRTGNLDGFKPAVV